MVVFYFLFLGIMCTNKSNYLRTFSKNYKHLNLLQNCNDTENDFLNVFSQMPEYLSAVAGMFKQMEKTSEKIFEVSFPV